MEDRKIVQGMEEIAAFKSLNLGCRRVLWFAINLINRQKAEIEKKNTEIDILIEKKDTLQDENSELMAEVERLKDIAKGALTESIKLSDCIQQAKR